MSDRSVETGFTPVLLAAAQARGGGFRPLHLGPAPRAAEAPPPAPEPAEAEPADDPFARGLAEGQRLAEAGFAVERHQLLALVAAAEALQDEPSEELAQLIAETVERLVRQIVESAPIDAEWLQTQADIAAAMVAEADKARTLWVNPADAVLLSGSGIALPIEADAAMMRGTVRIETSTGWIEHGRAVYLDELRAALGSQDAAA
ncbi:MULTISPECIES: FliH/SctL family protein [Sphingopyxis]|jgi:flagellar assembly protein FliH|uniref:Flagellar biosynthetic protein n=1 Tax=Sphingopyxis granuli TaxID=267128 RepID=A0AA86L6E4_9SPHN|nr:MULTISPECIES: flagellar biosynthetic protein [Sphingopyxis]AMG76420.1 Flagellar biosynthetic protein [Sphingopyxis granuli]APW73972.1 flagellar biosynthetic protein [Sphingopyxis granuli]AVA15301.1 flagellar biosynthetic protein [Sphingopyxis sp. MG]ODU28540.1 MAG: flagellar biosynthetic protein [Sphingopyxis sp. SCN 67-31]